MMLAYARVYLHFLQHKAKVCFKHLAIGYKLAGYGFGGVYIYREAKALCALYNGRVYAYYFAIGIDHRSSGIARVERSVRLNNVINQPARLRSQGAAQSAYHARGYGMLVAIRVADGYDELADLQIAGIAEFGYRVAVGIYLENGQVCIGVFADKGGFNLVFVKQAYHYFLGAIYHVAVGEDEAIRREYKTRTGAGRAELVVFIFFEDIYTNDRVLCFFSTASIITLENGSIRVVL